MATTPYASRLDSVSHWFLHPRLDERPKHLLVPFFRWPLLRGDFVPARLSSWHKVGLIGNGRDMQLNTLISYLIDAYTSNAASAVAANTFLRSLVA